MTLILDEGIRCGAVLAGADGEAVRAQAQRIEAAGFDSLWVGDHIAFHISVTDALSLLSFAAAATERIQLGTSVYLLPLRHPTITAKVVATVDRLSGGRLQLGIGVGGEYPPEFEAVGSPHAERGARCDEAIEIMRKLWTEERTGHDGRHFQFGPISLQPKPVQKGGPPILVGGRKAPAFRRAGRLGDGYISHMCSPEMYAENLDAIQRHADAAGRGDIPFQTAAFLFTILDDDWDRAHERAKKALEAIYRVSFETAARKYCLLGPPDACREQMQRFEAAGCRRFILSPLMDSTEFLDRSAEQLLPALTE